MPPLNRRAFIQSSLVAGLVPLARPLSAAEAAASTGLDFGKPEAFSFDAFVERARVLAAKPYVAPYRPAPDVVAKIDYDAHGKIRFKPDRALFAKVPGPYPGMFFHLCQWFT